jgi:predicted nucleotidyltransferase
MKISLHKVLARFPIQFAYLFGSHAAGHPHAHSDVDIAIYPKESLTRSQAFRLRMKVMEAVMDDLHENRVDVIDLREAPLPLRFRAIQPSCVLFSRSEAKRVRFEVATRSEYFDRLPQIERSNAVAFARMAKAGLR